MYKKLSYTILGLTLLIAGAVSASQISVPSAPGPGYLLQSTSTGQYLLASLLAGSNITISTTSNSITISSSGGGSSFPFTPAVGYNATSTAIGFLAGLFSNSSTTINGNLFLPTLSQGFLYTGSNGVAKTVASSSINLSSLNNDLANLTAGDTSLTLSGSYNGATARTVVLNVANSNTWTALQKFFGQASTTQLSIFNKAYFGATATTTIDGTGNVVIPSGSTLTNTGVTNGCGTWASGVLGSTGIACGSGGGSDPFTHFFPWLSATTSAMAIGTSTISTAQSAQLTVASTTAPQLSLFDGVNTNGWVFRNAGGNLYLATTTSGGLSTTTLSAFTILSSNGNVGVASSSPLEKFSVEGNTNITGGRITFGKFFPESDCRDVLVSSYCVQLNGDDNTVGGVGYYVRNKNAGSSAYAGYSIFNDLIGNATTNYSGLFTNSSVYNDNTFGTLNNVPNLMQVGNSMGGVSIQSFSPTIARSYINFSVASTTPGAGPATADEVMRIITGGLANSEVGIGTTSPVSKLTVVGGAILNAELKVATTTAISLSMASSTAQLVQTGVSATTITLTNLFAGQATRIVVCNPNAVAGALTWATTPANSLLWTGGAVPVQTTTANKCDIWTFTTTQATSTSGAVKVFGSMVPNY